MDSVELVVAVEEVPPPTVVVGAGALPLRLDGLRLREANSDGEDDALWSVGVASRKVRARTRLRTRAENAPLLVVVGAVKARGRDVECADDERRARDAAAVAVFRSCIARCLNRVISIKRSLEKDRTGSSILPVNALFGFTQWRIRQMNRIDGRRRHCWNFGGSSPPSLDVKKLCFVFDVRGAGRSCRAVRSL